ncbi:MAG: M16 family metallopeptidase [Phycisphaerales bacterium JB061]
MKKLSTLGLVASAGLAGSVGAQQLEMRSDVVSGTLDNGMAYIIKEHANPPGRSAMYLHISSGSLNETDDIQGISHFLEHMAFNGSENFAPGELIPFFESIGLTFGRHQNAFTSFDQTTYILELPDAERDTLDKAMLFFSDVAFGLSLLQDEIDEERGVILEERRTRLSPQQRVQEEFFRRLAPGSTFGHRLPIGIEETLLTMQQKDFRQYVDTWYVPSNMTLIVVADADSDMILEEIRENFERGEFVERPADLDINLTPYDSMRSVVITDDELTESSIQIINIREPLPAVTTKEGMRQSLIEDLASSVFNRRLRKKINEGQTTMLSGGAFMSDLFNAVRVSIINADGRPDQWEALLEESARELRRARLHGFTSREIDDARKAVIASAERSAESEETLPARAILGSINSSVATGATVLSAAQRLELVNELVPTISDEEVSDSFDELYDDEKVSIVLTAPSAIDVPTEDELLALSREALAVTPEADVETDRPTELMASIPAGGEVTDVERHEATGVWSAWLDNGIRVHYRDMDYRKDSATITITLAGGKILENAQNKGVSEVAALAFLQPATRNLTSTNISDLMTGKKASFRGGGAGSDTISMSVSGNPDDMESAMQLAHLMLSEPVIEQSALDRWRDGQIQAIEQRKTLPMGKLQELLPTMISPEGETRLTPMSLERVEAITLDEAQDWLDYTVQTAPIEVSIVGDIDKQAAFDLVATYLGSLPARERISEDTLDEHRNIAHPEGPIEAFETMQTKTPMAIAVAGSFGPDQSNIRDVRLIRMATQILSTRMVKRIREEQQLVYSISAISQPSTAYPGMGLIFAAGPCMPGNEGKLASEIQSMFAEFAEFGPSGEEVETARGQMFNTLDEQLQEPGYWTGTLEDMTYRGTSLDDVAAIEQDYASFTADEIREAFDRYYGEESKVSVTVAPEPTEEGG